MKKILLPLLFVAIAMPLLSSAHSGDTSSFSNTDFGQGFMMMQEAEDRALGNDLHEEMEGLMLKTISDDMSQADMDRLLVLMDEHPGAGSMMMGRMMGGYYNTGSGCFFSAGSMYGFHRGSGLWGSLFMIIFWGLAITGLVTALKYVRNNRKSK